MLFGILTTIYVLAGPPPDVIVRSSTLLPLDACEQVAAGWQATEDKLSVPFVEDPPGSPRRPVLRVLYKCVPIQQQWLEEGRRLARTDMKSPS